MIQRIQSLWFVLAAICGGLTFQFPFYGGTRMMGGDGTETSTGQQMVAAVMTSTFNIPIIIFMSIAIVGAIHGLFSYYNRKHQFVVTLISMISAIVALVLLFMATSKFESGGIRIEALLYFAVPVFLFLAAKGVRKDQNLIKSMDRLR